MKNYFTLVLFSENYNKYFPYEKLKKIHIKKLNDLIRGSGHTMTIGNKSM